MDKNPCQVLTELHDGLNFFDRDQVRLNELLNEGDGDGLAEILSFVKERESLYSEYQSQVKRMLNKWLGIEIFSNVVKFAEDGRVIIDCNLEFDRNYKGEFFPSLIKKINGDLSIKTHSFDKLDFLEEVTGDLRFVGSSISSLRRLVRVDGDLNAEGGRNLDDLSSLESFGGSLRIGYTRLKSLPSLFHVGGELHADGLSSLTSLPNLVRAGSLELRGTQVVSLPSLKIVLNDFSGCRSLVELPRLREVGELNLVGTKVESLPKLKTVDYQFVPSWELKSVPELVRAGTIIVGGSEIKEMPQLRELDGFLSLRYTKIRRLEKAFPNLERIGEKGGVSFQATNLFLVMQLRRLRRKGKIEIEGKIKKSKTGLMYFLAVFSGYR
jgi:hypothetical protein